MAKWVFQHLHKYIFRFRSLVLRTFRYHDSGKILQELSRWADSKDIKIVCKDYPSESKLGNIAYVNVVLSKQRLSSSVNVEVSLMMTQARQKISEESIRPPIKPLSHWESFKDHP